MSRSTRVSGPPAAQAPVRDAGEVLRLLEQRPYDLIFMDCMMPGLDGYAATAEIRRIEGAGGRTPIVALAANASARTAERPPFCCSFPSRRAPSGLEISYAATGRPSRIVRGHRA
jgi:CheY-like chemotaxis protein